MEITLSKKDKDEIVYKLRLALMKDIKAMLAEVKEPEMVTTAEAARILKISEGRMRQIADKYPHTKRGENKQGKLMFLRSGLI